MSQVDHHRAQILRQQCNRHFVDKSIHDVIGALQMLVADVITGLPGVEESVCLQAHEAFAKDVRTIISERFAMRRQGGGH